MGEAGARVETGAGAAVVDWVAESAAARVATAVGATVAGAAGVRAEAVAAWAAVVHWADWAGMAVGADLRVARRLLNVKYIPRVFEQSGSVVVWVAEALVVGRAAMVVAADRVVGRVAMEAACAQKTEQKEQAKCDGSVFWYVIECAEFDVWKRTTELPWCRSADHNSTTVRERACWTCCRPGLAWPP